VCPGPVRTVSVAVRKRPFLWDGGFFVSAFDHGCPEAFVTPRWGVLPPQSRHIVKGTRSLRNGIAPTGGDTDTVTVRHTPCATVYGATMGNKVNPLWDEFIGWLNASEIARGPLASEEEWAAAKGVTTRTLRRWKTQPEFAARKLELEAQPTVTEVTEVPEEDVVGDEADYRVVKTTLVEGAKSGNPKYLDLYFKTYGKPFVEDEAASRVSDVASTDLENLVLESILALGESLVVDALKSRGWAVERDDNSSTRVS
jgi:hypothetical protein